MRHRHELEIRELADRLSALQAELKPMKGELLIAGKARVLSKISHACEQMDGAVKIISKDLLAA